MEKSLVSGKSKLFSTNRIETLTDGVFAFAMTMLVTGLDIPQLNGMIASYSVDKILFDLAPDFIHYILAFILLANFWWAHHERSHYLQSIDKHMILLNMMSLLFVGLIPFSTNLVGDFPLNTHAAIIFEVNLFILGLLSVFQWNHVLTSTMCQKPGVDFNEIILNREDAFIFPVLSLVGIVFALCAVPWSAFVYVVAPIYIIMVKWRDAQSHKKESPHT